MNHLSCEQRVRAVYKERIEELWSMFRAMESDDEDTREKAFQEFNEYGLCFDYVEPETNYNPDKEGYFRYQLSWGGPGDEFRFFTGPNFKPYRIEYWFLDWFDGASITLKGADFDLLLQVFRDFKGCSMVDKAFEDFHVRD